MAPRKPAAPVKPPRAKPGPKPRVAAAPAEVDTRTTTRALPPTAAYPSTATSPRRTFDFTLGETVTISRSNEIGTVRARAEWFSGNISYLIAYTSSRGEFHEAWIDQDLLSGDL